MYTHMYMYVPYNIPYPKNQPKYRTIQNFIFGEIANSRNWRIIFWQMPINFLTHPNSFRLADKGQCNVN